MSVCGAQPALPVAAATPGEAAAAKYGRMAQGLWAAACTAALVYAAAIPLELPGSPILAALPFWPLAAVWLLRMRGSVRWLMVAALIVRSYVANLLDLEPVHFYRPATVSITLTYTLLLLAVWPRLRGETRGGQGATVVAAVTIVILCVATAWLLVPAQQDAVLPLLIPLLLLLAVAGAALAAALPGVGGALAATAVVTAELLAAWRGLGRAPDSDGFTVATWILLFGGLAALAALSRASLACDGFAPAEGQSR